MYKDPNTPGMGYGLRQIPGMVPQAVEIIVNVNSGDATYRTLSKAVAKEFWDAVTLSDAEGTTTTVQVGSNNTNPGQR